MAIVLETSKFSGAYVLGFRVENVDRVFEEISSLFNTFIEKPVYGVQCYYEDADTNIDLLTIAREEDKLEIIETGYEHVRSITNTYAVDKKKAGGNEIEFNEDLGLACEKMPPGQTIDKLWRIV